MHKLVKIIADRAAQQQQQQQQQQLGSGGGAGGAGGVGGAAAAVTLPNGQVLPPLDPSQLAFARAAFPFQASAQGELSLQVDEIVAIMAKHDPSTGAEVDPRMQVETEWWKGRTREGREGWFPRAFVEVLERRAPEGKKV
ncbi:hypothetical protein BC826DRAFT_1024459 [Russula brevipes]|nr:hypothetical protein BC826DRAFT_1024459 [Russula brevipes]